LQICIARLLYGIKERSELFGFALDFAVLRLIRRFLIGGIQERSKQYEFGPSSNPFIHRGFRSDATVGDGCGRSEPRLFGLGTRSNSC
jgi:hypothetical protein